MNVLDEINEKLSEVLKRISVLEQTKSAAPSRVLLSDFCKSQGISRPTAHAWSTKGLIKMEKIGSRNFVVTDSVTVKKYQRKPLED